MGEKVEVKFNLQVNSRTVEASAWVPAGPAYLVQIVPVVHAITSAVVQVGIEEVEEKGKTISCKAGCGACCRQMVPVTEAEAYYLTALVASLPPERREAVLNRFVEAIRRLEEAGLAERVQRLREFDSEERLQISDAYFRLRIACPFLEEESCSIHPYRPAVCRQYLVTSPPENCWNPGSGTLEPVPAYGRPVPGMGEILSQGEDSEPRVRHMALLYSLAWADENPQEEPRFTGPELLRRFLRGLAGPNDTKRPASGTSAGLSTD